MPATPAGPTARRARPLIGLTAGNDSEIVATHTRFDCEPDMRRLLIFQHVPYEILGILDPLLHQAGFDLCYINFGQQPDAQPDVTPYDGLIVLGGPMNCDESDRYPHLATEVELIRKTIDDDKPVLGICLGAQLIARALGARVTPHDVKEIGWYELNPTTAGRTDALFAHFAASQMIFQWHGDRFDIPDGAVHLATSPDCANQAFRYGDNVYALQFHLEVDAPMIHRWLQEPTMVREAISVGGEACPQEIEAATTAHIDQSIALGHRVFGEFIRRFQTHPRQQNQARPTRNKIHP